MSVYASTAYLTDKGQTIQTAALTWSGFWSCLAQSISGLASYLFRIISFSLISLVFSEQLTQLGPNKTRLRMHEAVDPSNKSLNLNLNVSHQPLNSHWLMRKSYSDEWRRFSTHIITKTLFHLILQPGTHGIWVKHFHTIIKEIDLNQWEQLDGNIFPHTSFPVHTHPSSPQLCVFFFGC